MPGVLFCDACGASIVQGNVVRKLRQASFDTVTDAKGGLLSPGKRIRARHTYLIEEAIARSGFGATFRALRLGDEKQVLIKQMLEQSSYDDLKSELMKSFKREAKFLRKVKHPAFPHGHEYFLKNKSFYLVMDFINGKELSKAVQEYRTKNNNKVEDGLIVHLGMEIADALEVIHGFGYIYRDLKPQNVMLDGISSRVRLIDFGTLYHSADPKPLIFESEGYTPPEFLDRNIRFTPAGDVYSLGALLYEVATGETPALGQTKALENSKRDPRLIKAILKCLKVNPAERYQRARHLRDDLSKLTWKGIWPFVRKDAISRIELAVLPKTLFPASCTFCEFCGYADPKSEAGYCRKCRVALKVGRLVAFDPKDGQKEFFLYSDETIVGSSKQAHFTVADPKNKNGLEGKHLRIFRKGPGLWAECLAKNSDNTSINGRKFVGPVQLIHQDVIKIGELTLKFTLRDAC